MSIAWGAMFGGISNINEIISKTKVVYIPRDWAKYKATMLVAVNEDGLKGTIFKIITDKGIVLLKAINHE